MNKDEIYDFTQLQFNSNKLQTHGVEKGYIYIGQKYRAKMPKDPRKIRHSS